MKNILILLIVISLTSCLGTKKVTDKQAVTTTIEKVTTKTDSSSNTNTNQAIKDRIIINVPKADDENTTKMVNAVLSQLNTSKVSGNNSYTSTYDNETRQLIIDFIIAATQNKQTVKSTDTNSEQTFEKTVSENTKKVVKMIPWWIWLLVVIWFFPQILSRVMMIISPIKLLLTKQKR
tara:strand:- start:675 stop:1208 length:534 start_codon:yes stop_codon:yes gene_type:complete